MILQSHKCLEKKSGILLLLLLRHLLQRKRLSSIFYLCASKYHVKLQFIFVIDTQQLFMAQVLLEIVQIFFSTFTTSITINLIAI